jgi:hypothetical protein
MYFIVIIVSNLWWQRGNRVCNNKKQWAFWKMVLYNGSCFLVGIKHLLSILGKSCFIHDLTILICIIMSHTFIMVSVVCNNVRAFWCIYGIIHMFHDSLFDSTFNVYVTFLCHHQGVLHLCLTKLCKSLKMKLLNYNSIKLSRYTKILFNCCLVIQ